MYLYGFQLFFLDGFHYRFNAVVHLFFGNVSTIVTILFWVLIYRSNGAGDINGFSLSDMIAYYIVSSVIRGGVFSNSGFHYASLIRDGRLNSELLKPYSLNVSPYFRNLAGVITGIFPQFVLAALVLPVLAGTGADKYRICRYFEYIVRPGSCGNYYQEAGCPPCAGFSVVRPALYTADPEWRGYYYVVHDVAVFLCLRIYQGGWPEQSLFFHDVRFGEAKGDIRA